MEKVYDLDNVYDLLKIHMALHASQINKKIIDEINEIYELSRSEYRGTNKDDT